ncbi:TonB family protein [Bacterioplanoides sp. SCSIO 12839]|uniref:TonB family protein n=1 Tax=Bacterioplanoides sp. SCSIO 12839 TaxID=2829569 RepID=UPI002104900C|nr:TonB family protein [Bacterioplanoides sp. SCSIO 12839]UTW48394.1 TonB family protein [Bacterioplanoides sp. SCSIO 12839]
MLRYLFSFFLLTSLLTHTENQAQAANLVLNGSANYTHLTRDYYSAALYLEQHEQSITAIKSSQSDKSMRLIVINRWTPRKWKSHWQGNISINNDTLPSNRQQSEALMAFINLPQNNLEPGDDIRIQTSASSTQVYLNDELAISAPGQTLFLYLLNTWVGKFPPSREFRDQILGIKLNPETREQIENHSIPTARLGLLTSWKAEQQLQRRNKQQARLKQEQIKQQREAEERRQRRLEEQRKLEEQQARIAEQQRLDKLAAAEHARKIKHKKQAEQRQSQRLQEKKNNQQAELKRQQDNDEQRFYKEHYHWQLQRALNNEIRYPPWARQFNQEGDIQILLTVNQAGEVVEQQLITTEQPELLFEEFQRALGVITSQVKPHEDLKGSPWKLKLSHLFSLTSENSVPAPEPEQPESLKNKAEKIESTAQQISYQQRVKEQITQSLVYPKAAQILKKEGEIIVEIELGADGSILAITDTQLTRHRELNRAFKKAIQDSEPFDPVPGEKPIRIIMSYQFRLK